MRVTKGRPHWIHLNIRDLASRVNLEIDAYEQELRASADARLTFHEESGKYYIKTVPTDAARVADALRSVPVSATSFIKPSAVKPGNWVTSRPSVIVIKSP